MIRFGCIGAYFVTTIGGLFGGGTASVGGFVILRSNLCLGVIEGGSCRLSGIFTLKILCHCSRARNYSSLYRA